MATLKPIACGFFLIAAFMVAGVAQVAWMALPWSRHFSIPLDGGATFRGRRIFGGNKTLRGFLVMVPAAAASFAVLARAAGHGDPGAAGLWPLTSGGYAALGAWAALGFMCGELPNSLVKRQLDIAPGAAAASRAVRIPQLLVDRLDSGIGMLTFVAIAVPTPPLTWAVVLGVGPALHWLFSVAMFRLHVKPRMA
jgi:hypothetical protein